MNCSLSKKMAGGNPAVSGNDEISTSLCWRLTRAARDPLDSPAIAHFLRLGYRRSTLKHIRTYLKATLEYAVDEGLVNRNPARTLELPKAQKSRERFYSFAEIKQLLSVSAGRENLVLRVLLFCGYAQRSCWLSELKTLAPINCA